MKKIFYSIFLVLVFTGKIYSQTNAQLAHNNKTVSNKGYQYSFSCSQNYLAPSINCLGGQSTPGAIYNPTLFSGVNFTMDSINNSLIYHMDAAASSSFNGPLVLFTKDNCNYLDTLLDFSTDQNIHVRLKSDADVLVKIYPVSLVNSNYITLDNFTAGSISLQGGNNFIETTLAMADQSMNNTGDISKIVGWKIVGIVSTPMGYPVNITIDNITFGDAQALNISTKENKNINEVLLYPSPVTDVLFLSFKSLEKTSLIISDIAGKIVISQIALEGQHYLSFNTKEFSEGVYMLTILGDSGTVSRKFVVN